MYVCIHYVYVWDYPFCIHFVLYVYIATCMYTMYNIYIYTCNNNYINITRERYRGTRGNGHGDLRFLEYRSIGLAGNGQPHPGQVLATSIFMAETIWFSRKSPKKLGIPHFWTLSMKKKVLEQQWAARKAAMVAASKNMISSTDQLVRLADLCLG